VRDARATKIPFSTQRMEVRGAWKDERYIYFKKERIIALDEVLLVGEHTQENILAAICASSVLGATPDGMPHVLRTFSGVAHRLQFVEKIDGRLFYNDSKATNLLATQKALQAFSKPVIFLAGGLDRGNSFQPLQDYMGHVKALITFGETATRLADFAKEA